MSGKSTLEFTEKKKGKLSLKDLMGKQVYVGYPQGPRHSDSKLTNAQIAFLNTNGVRPNKASKDIKTMMDSTGSDYSTALKAYIRSKGDPLWRVPPRPFIEPAIDRVKEKIADKIRDIIDSYLDGDKQEAENKRTELGLFSVNEIRRFIQEYPANGLAPNAPSVIEKKGMDHPLIGTTGELLRSLTYVITAEELNNATGKRS